MVGTIGDLYDLFLFCPTCTIHTLIGNTAQWSVTFNFFCIFPRWVDMFSPLLFPGIHFTVAIC